MISDMFLARCWFRRSAHRISLIRCRCCFPLLLFPPLFLMYFRYTFVMYVISSTGTGRLCVWVRVCVLLEIAGSSASGSPSSAPACCLDSLPRMLTHVRLAAFNRFPPLQLPFIAFIARFIRDVLQNFLLRCVSDVDCLQFEPIAYRWLRMHLSLGGVSVTEARAGFLLGNFQNYNFDLINNL